VVAESRKQGQGGMEVEEVKKERGSRPCVHFIGVRCRGDSDVAAAPWSGRWAWAKRRWFGHYGLQVGPAWYN
jgi:hypothetical protein